MEGTEKVPVPGVSRAAEAAAEIERTPSFRPGCRPEKAGPETDLQRKKAEYRFGRRASFPPGSRMIFLRREVKHANDPERS
jgi:hypothetical protein